LRLVLLMFDSPFEEALANKGALAFVLLL